MTAREDLRMDIWEVIPDEDAEAVIDAYRAEVLAEADDRLAAMTMPEDLQHTINAATYRHAWLNCRAIVKDMAGKDTRGSGQPSTGESTRVTEYGVRVPEEDGTSEVLYVTEDQALAADALRGHRSVWPGIGQELVQRTVSYSPWTQPGESPQPPPDEPFVPRTEREYWVNIATALNAANAAGMPVGINMEGLLTDHAMWAVVWNRQTEEWEVGGYDDEPPAETPDPDRWLSCSRTGPSCPNAERARYAVERGWTQDGRAGDWLCAGHAPTGFFQSEHTYTRQHHGDRIEFLVEHIATPPGADHLIAFGWRRDPDEGWVPSDSDDVEGWTEVTEATQDEQLDESTEPATVEFSDGTVTLTRWHLVELAPDYYGISHMQIGGWLPEGWKSGSISLGTNSMVRADLPGAAAPAPDLNVQIGVKGYGGPQRFMKIQWRKDSGERRG